MFDEIVNAIIALLAGLNLYSGVSVGTMPSRGGIACYFGPGRLLSQDMTRAAVYEVPIVFNARHADQQIAVAALSLIVMRLTQLLTYPPGESWQITNIETALTPSYSGRLDDNEYLYTTSVQALVRMKGA